MNPPLSFNSLKYKLGRFKFLILLLTILTITAFGFYKLGAYRGQEQQQTIEEQETRLAGLYRELDEKIRQINYLSVELEVESNANSQIQSELLDIREELFSLRKELNFYQKVMAPELVADGLSIEQFSVEKGSLDNVYKFKFALVQTDAKKRNAKGYIRLNLLGIEGGQRRSKDLAKMANLSAEALKFSFHYFQYFEGEFKLEPDFLPEDIEIKVIQPKTKWQPYKAFSQKLEWPEISR